LRFQSSQVASTFRFKYDKINLKESNWIIKFEIRSNVVIKMPLPRDEWWIWFNFFRLFFLVAFRCVSSLYTNARTHTHTIYIYRRHNQIKEVVNKLIFQNERAFLSHVLYLATISEYQSTIRRKKIMYISFKYGNIFLFSFWLWWLWRRTVAACGISFNKRTIPISKKIYWYSFLHLSRILYSFGTAIMSVKWQWL
jgi:hypothetical protein